MTIPVYETIGEAVADLKRKGYRDELLLSEVADCLVCETKGKAIFAEDFEVDELYCFEGEVYPGDETIVYAVSALSLEVKGVLINAFGKYLDPMRSAVAAKLHMYRERMVRPLKRVPALQPLSREHDYTLLFCLIIRLGLSRKIEPSRLNAYTQFFRHEYLEPHFRIEEEKIFPELGNEHPMVVRALKEHRQIENLLNRTMQHESEFVLLQSLLDGHIRFEERVLFQEMQLQLLPEALQRIAAVHREVEIRNEWKDPFWH